MEAGWRTIATPRPSWQPASRPRPPAAITWSSCAGRTAFAARTILVQIFACPEREIEASFPPAYLLHAGGAKPGPKPHMAMSLTAQNQIEPDSSESFRGLEPIYILGIARMAWTYSPLRDGTALRRFAMILSACAPQHATRCNRLAVPRGPPAASPAGFPNPTTTALRRGSPPIRCPKRQARARDTQRLPIHFAQVPNRQGRRRRRPQSRNRPDSVRFFGAISCYLLRLRRYWSARRRARLPPLPALTSKYVLRPIPIRPACPVIPPCRILRTGVVWRLHGGDHRGGTASIRQCSLFFIVATGARFFSARFPQAAAAPRRRRGSLTEAAR